MDGREKGFRKGEGRGGPGVFPYKKDSGAGWKF